MTICPTCGHRTTEKKAKVPALDLPELTATPGAERLLAHYDANPPERRSRKRRYEHEHDFVLRRAQPELWEWLARASVAGRVKRFYAADPGRFYLETPDGVNPFRLGATFASLTPAEVVALAPVIADGRQRASWQRRAELEVAA